MKEERLDCIDLLMEEDGEITGNSPSLDRSAGDRTPDGLEQLRAEHDALKINYEKMEAQLKVYTDKQLCTREVQTDPISSISVAVQTASVGLDGDEPILSEWGTQIKTNDNQPILPDWGTQIKTNDIDVEIKEEEEEEGEVKEAPKSITEALTEAAQSAVQQMGYVYDSRSGLYYDYHSGYYYDAETQLFYEPHSGTYYSYDPESGSYAFHSQVDPQLYQNYSQKHNQWRGQSDWQQSGKRKREKENSTNEKQGCHSSEKRSRNTESEKKQKKSKNKSKKNQQMVFAAAPSNYSLDLNKRRVTDLLEVKKRELMVELQSMEEAADETQSTDEHENFTSVDSCKTKDLHEQTLKHSPGDDELVQAENNDSDNCSEQERTCPEESHEQELCTKVTSEPLRLTSLQEEVQSCEEGELSDTSSLGDPQLEARQSSAEESDSSSESEECADAWPPCIRAMVLTSDCVQQGTLHIITCSGATIGREENLGHTLVLKEQQISKMHCSFAFNESLQSYTIKDHASQNGTFLNEQRVAEAKVVSDEFVVQHRDKVQLGSTTLELHIHQSNGTCPDCEPGLVQQTSTAEEMTEQQKSKEASRKEELKRIRKKYGLQGAMPVPKLPAGLSDKAEARRRTVGSDNPHVQERETAPASVHVPLASENKGHKLLSKLGWKEGEGLGKSRAGMTQPINVKLRTNAAAGLGSASAIEQSVDAASIKPASEKWRRAQVRYQQLQPVPSVFTQNDDEDDTAMETQTTGVKNSNTVKQNESLKLSSNAKNKKQQKQQKWVSGGVQ